jgi:hypothetical protein
MTRLAVSLQEKRGGVLLLVLLVIVALAGSAAFLADTALVRYERDVTRMVFNDNIELLDDVRHTVGFSGDSLSELLSTATYEPRSDRAYIVISVKENRLWYKRGDSTLMEARVATGSGRTLVREGEAIHYKFDTPRGRLVVQRKDIDPAWVPPDWHYNEQAAKEGVPTVRLLRGESIHAPDGSMLTVLLNDVVVQQPDGGQSVVQATDGREIVFAGQMVIPPFGTNQRKYLGVLGTRRLYLGDGYGIHGTNVPSSIGQSVSHGCVRMLNEEIERLYEMVEVGTPVFIY